MVFQYSALLSSRNVRDNVALPLEELTDKSRSEIDKIVDEKLELVGMGDSKELLPEELVVECESGLRWRARSCSIPNCFYWTSPRRSRPSHCLGDRRRINNQPKREIEGHIHYCHPRNGQRLSHRHANGYVVPGNNH